MQINGQPISTAAGSTLSQLLAQQGFDVAASPSNSTENHLPAAISAKCSSADSDTIEVVQFVGGG